MPKKLAFFTFGHLVEEVGHPAVQEFFDRVPAVFGSAQATEGFLDRSRRNMEDYTHSWGEIVIPKCWAATSALKVAAMLSLWDDLESVAAFSYHGAHGEAMKKRKEWFVDTSLPEQTAWWVEDEPVDFQTAAQRMDYLFENGPSAHAFNLRRPFGPDGAPYQLNTERIRRKASVNR